MEQPQPKQKTFEEPLRAETTKSISEELSKFLRAKQYNDLEFMCSLLGSTDEIDESSQYPWAEKMTNLGALVTSYLGNVLNANQLQLKPENKQVILDENLIPELIDNIQNSERDIKEQSLMALLLIIDPDDPSNRFRDILWNHGGLQAIGQMLNDIKEEMQGNAAQLLRNIYVRRPVYMSKMHDSKATTTMLAILPNFRDPQYFCAQLKHLLDFIYDESYDIIPENVSYMKDMRISGQLVQAEKSVKSMKKRELTGFKDYEEEIQKSLTLLKVNLDLS